MHVDMTQGKVEQLAGHVCMNIDMTQSKDVQLTEHAYMNVEMTQGKVYSCQNMLA